MNYTMLQNKIWWLCRVNGPSNGFPVPLDTSDFPPATVQADINIALSQFISDTGLAPGISDVMLTEPILPVLDLPVPPDMISLSHIEYSTVGGQTYPLQGCSFQEWDQRTGSVTVSAATGWPYIFRQPYAGYIRLQPQPGPGQAASAGAGNVYINGIPSVDDPFTVSISYLGQNATVTYLAVAGDTQVSVAAALMALINQSSVITGWGINASASPYAANAIVLFASNTDPISYNCSTTSGTCQITPLTKTTFVSIGDTITWYYSSNGRVLTNPGDVPGIPPNFHIALCYRVVADYWPHKGFPDLGAYYMKMYENAVQKGKKFTYDSNRATESTMASYDGDNAWITGPVSW